MSPSEPFNVLIVDDDRSVQRVLAEVLIRQGYVVTVERDGEWAVRTFAKKRFDLVVLDLLLPGLSGFEVAAQLRQMEHGRDVPIVMISGVYKSPVHRKEALERHHALALLDKPIDLSELKRLIGDALGQPTAPPPEPPPGPQEEDAKTGEFMADDVQREEAAWVEQTIEAAPPAPPTPPPPTPPTPPPPPVVEHARAPDAATAPSVATSPSVAPVRADRARTRELKRPLPKPAAPLNPGSSSWEPVATTPFARLVAEAYRTRFTGALRLRRSSVKKIVYFRDGTAESVKSNLLVECLGRVLVKEKLISAAECEESLARMKQSKRLQGTVLIEMGCISPHNLQHALLLQLQHKIYDAFSWDTGEYQFVADAPLPSEPLIIGMTAAQLIHEGVRRTYDERRLARVFHDQDGLYVAPSQDPLYLLQEANLGPEEHELLQLADGHKTLATLKALEILPPFETDRFFFAMSCAQMVEFVERPTEGRPRVSLAELAASTKAAAEPRLKSKPSAAPPPLPPPLPKKAPAPELPWVDVSAPRPQPSPAAAAPVPLQPPTSPPASAHEPTPKRREPLVPKSMGSLLPELSDVVSLPRVSSQEGERRERLATLLASMRKKTYFELLGVEESAEREVIKRAYFAMAKEYHPDRLHSTSGPETRALAQQVYDLISTAHDTLTDPTERKRYSESLATGYKPVDDANVSKVLAAEGKFQRGEEQMAARHFDHAYKSFTEAIALYPDEGEFHAWAGWALFQADARRAEDAMRELEKAIALSPQLDKPYLFLGYVHKATGRPDRAERQFEKAIQANPDCTEALRELRLLGKQRK